MTEIKPTGRKVADVKIFIAMPALDGRMHCVTAGSLLDSMAIMIAIGIPNTPHVEFAMQDSNLPFARNRVVAEFMSTDCTDLIFVDADMSWDHHSWARLICHPVDFVGATYRQKIQDPVTGQLMTRYALDFLVQEDGETIKGTDPETGLFEVKRLPAGFLRITRKAIQRMINECDVPEFEIERHGKKMVIHRLFSNEWHPELGQDIGEDYTFCDRWRSIGGKVWCDPELRVGHHGLASFHGHFGEFMREKQRKPAEIEVVAKHDADQAA